MGLILKLLLQPLLPPLPLDNLTDLAMTSLSVLIYLPVREPSSGSNQFLSGIRLLFAPDWASGIVIAYAV